MISSKKYFVLSIAIILFLLLSFTPIVASDVRTDSFNYPNIVSDDIFWFVHITDIHIGAIEYLTLKDKPFERNLNWIINNIPLFINPKFVVATGDLTDALTAVNRDEQWDLYKDIILSHPEFTKIYYDIPGNHDRYGDLEWDGSEAPVHIGPNGYLYNSWRGSLQRLFANPDDPVGQFSWSVTSPAGDGNYFFVTANTCDKKGKLFADYAAGRISDIPELSIKESDYIQNQLNRFYVKHTYGDNPKLSFIFGHHGLYTRESDLDISWLPDNISRLPGLKDRGFGGDELQNIFKNRQVSAYIYGHTHNKEEFFDSTTLQLNTAALVDGNYRIVAVDNNGVSTTTETVDKWPVVLITAPVDKKLGGTNPYAYSVPTTAANPVRALIFTDPDYCYIWSVKLIVDNQDVALMERVSGNREDPLYNLWQGAWDTRQETPGKHNVTVWAECAKPVDYVPPPLVIGSDSITVNVKPNAVGSLSVYDFWKKADPIYADPSSDAWHPNFDAQYKIRNSGSKRIFIERLALAIHDSENKHLWDMLNPNTGQPRYYNNLTLNPGGTKYFEFSVDYFREPGNYKVVAKAKINGLWNELAYVDVRVIAGQITVLSPNGGESWQPGSQHKIKWISNGNIGSNVKIELYKGESKDKTIKSSTSNDGSYTWNVSDSQKPGANYRIKITSTSNSSYSDFSDSYFTCENTGSVFYTFRGNIGWVNVLNNPHGFKVGDQFEGVLSYSLNALDLNPDPNKGEYKLSDPNGVYLYIGQIRYGTDENYPQYGIWTYNDRQLDILVDQITFQTYNPKPLSNSIYINISDNNANMLSNDGLPSFISNYSEFSVAIFDENGQIAAAGAIINVP